MTLSSLQFSPFTAASLLFVLMCVCAPDPALSAQPGEADPSGGQRGAAQSQEDILAEATQLNRRVVELYGQGKYDEALPIAERVLALREKALGSEHLDVAAALNNLAALHNRRGDLARAEALYKRVLAIREKVLGPEHSDVATVLVNLGGLYEKQNNLTLAIPLYQRALSITEKREGAEHPDVASRLIDLAGAYQEAGDFNLAESLFQRALEVREKALGPEHLEVARALSNLAQLKTTRGDYTRAETLLQRALAITEKTLGADHPDVATIANNLGELYRAIGDLERSEPLLKRALDIREKKLAPNHPEVIGTLSNLAGLYVRKGDYGLAEQLYRRALVTAEQAFGRGHPLIAQVLVNFAMLYTLKGDYLTAEPLYRRAITILEGAFGTEHPHVAIVLNNLAGLYDLKGDFLHAEPLLQRVLVIREKAFGVDHPIVAESLSNLAQMYDKQGDYARAEPMYIRARAIFEKVLGPENPALVGVLSNLSELYRGQGNLTQAATLSERALAISEKALGPNHPNVALALNNLAEIYAQSGNFARAEPMLQRARLIYENALGASHPVLATVLQNFAELYLNEGDISRAITALSSANDIAENNLTLILTSGSEAQKLLYVAGLYRQTNAILSLHLRSAPSNAEAARLAITTVLRRKGRVLDALSDEIGALRRRLTPQDRALLDRLSNTRRQFSMLMFKPADSTPAGASQAEINKVRTEIGRIESEVAASARSVELRTQSQPLTITRVQRSIPATAALVEIISYRPYNTKAKTRSELFGETHYAAYVLRRGAPVRWVELGPSAPINQNVSQLRAALRDPRRTTVKEIARALDEQVMRPVRRLLGNAHQIFLSPDGELNLIPFAALVNEAGRYLVQDYSITYLTSGRDLLRFQASTQSRQPPVVMANPFFAKHIPNNNDASGKSAVRSAGFDERFSPLDGTEEEAKELGRMLGVRPLIREEATETALKQLHGPAILHIATHGFFLPDQALDINSIESARLFSGSSYIPAVITGENPLLRSGLALAGANERQGGNGEDGILTALEVSDLDLLGTKLVVLSACETGLGNVQNGEGVYGLRRALALAGAETQVISLWKVSDEATRDFMVDYYRRLQAGVKRSKALRLAQLKMLGDPATRHPYYWASFIQSGDWRNLGGKEANPE